MISSTVRELLDSPGRKLLAANSLRFRSAEFANELLESARSLRGTEPTRAQDCAELAVLIARHFGGDHLVRAAAEYGNILRIRGFYRRARLALSEALNHRSCSAAARLDTISYWPPSKSTFGIFLVRIAFCVPVSDWQSRTRTGLDS